jgi:hypothetical protein
MNKLTLLVTVGSWRVTDIRCPNNVLVRRKRSRTLVALVHSCNTVELKKSFADGRLFSNDTTICSRKIGIFNYFCSLLKHTTYAYIIYMNLTYTHTLCTWLSQHTSFLPHYLAQSDYLAANRQGQRDTRLTQTPSVIPNSNYIIMVSDWNCLKYFCMFCVLQSSCAQRLFEHLYIQLQCMIIIQYW